MTIQSTTALTALRIVLGGLIVAHGAMRVYLNTVWGFGEFLTLNGIPQGTIVAWALTSFEILGGLTFLLGKFVKPIGLIFAIHLSVGIYFVHLRNGWFVVGVGTGGMEYSALLVTSFLAVALSQGKWR